MSLTPETRSTCKYWKWLLSFCFGRAIAAAVAAVGLFLGGLHTGVDDLAGVLEGIHEVKVQYELLSNPVLELEAAPQENSAHDEQILDAEVVEEQQLPDE
ncbi:hypothetical protein [Corynebacterium occultum]|uniref:hypothetical protein n=1 Tax=Corynebacterium occultum TaxID=2675219 RepID=UPI0012E306D8|nr:hypothetical protein [Corynebacterium occultum]